MDQQGTETARAPAHGGVLVRPSSGTGIACLVLFAAAAALIAVNAAFGDALRIEPVWGDVLPWTTVACVAGAGVAGLIAITLHRERSLAVLLPTAIAVLLLGNELMQRIVGGS